MSFLGVRNGVSIALQTIASLATGKPYPTLALDFVNSNSLPSSVTFSRGTAATQYDSTGALIYSPMNAIRNNTMVGAVAGTPGTLPTNWSVVTVAGVNYEVVGTGVENGITCLDLRCYGTPSTSTFLNIVPDLVVAASVGQTWNGSFYSKLIAGSFTNAPPFIEIRESDSAQAFLTNTLTSISVGSTLQRYSQARTMTSATLAYVSVRQVFQITSGLAFDFTLRIGMPQLQLGSTATAVNATSGTAYYGPRFDYDPVTKTPRGLLIEEARTNSIRNNTMQGAVAGTPGTLPTNWGLSGLGTLTQTVSTGVIDGVNYIDVRLSGTTSTTQASLRFDATAGIAATNGQTWALSVWSAIIAGSTTNISSSGFSANLYDSGSVFLASLAFTGLPINTNATLTRGSSAPTIATVNTAFIQPQVYLNFASGVAIDITLRIGLPQLELGAFATSVIPTFGSTVTRNADTASIGTLTPWFNASAGTLYAEYSRFAAVNFQTVAYFGTPAQTDYMALLFGSSAPSNNQRFDVGVGGVSQASIAVLTTPPLNTITKTIGAYALNDFAATANGAAPGVDTVGTVPTVTLFGLGTGTALAGPYLNGYLRSIRYYPTRLPDSVLTGLTA